MAGLQSGDQLKEGKFFSGYPGPRPPLGSLHLGFVNPRDRTTQYFPHFAKQEVGQFLIWGRLKWLVSFGLLIAPLDVGNGDGVMGRE
jgi:hypothetical protein